MKIAIAGKGGSGKTTVAGLLTRLLADRGHCVWAIDADSNPNLGLTLGLAVGRAQAIKPLESGILRQTTDAKGQRTAELTMPPRAVVESYGLRVADRLTLLQMGTVDHAGAG